MPDAIIEGIRERISVAIKVNQSVGIQVPENRHGDLPEALFSFMKGNANDLWTFVSVSNTFHYISNTFKEIAGNKNVKFIDCISRAAGITDLQIDHCKFIESPTMLEKIGLEIMNNFQGVSKETDKYIIIDSLSAFMIYNDPDITREFVSLLMNRTRASNIHIISILIEEEIDSNKLIQLNDKIVVLRDSFID